MKKKHLHSLVVRFDKEINPVTLKQKIWEAVRGGWGEINIFIDGYPEQKFTSLRLKVIEDMMEEMAIKSADKINQKLKNDTVGFGADKTDNPGRTFSRPEC